MSRVLAADVGGTKALVRISDDEGMRFEKDYPCAAYADLEELLEAALHDAGAPVVEAACLAIAGPVQGDMAKLTNLPWEVSTSKLSARFRIERLQLVNDFVAVGHGINMLTPESLRILQAGKVRRDGIVLLAGAGTGLGVAWVLPDGAGYRVHPAEGGHMDFAPMTEQQDRLLSFLRQRHGHVSYERVVSGPGLVAIFDFLLARSALVAAHPLASAEQLDKAAAIAHMATGDELCAEALELFVSVYGAFVGNLALACLPGAGIYIAGGIAPKIAETMSAGGFMRALCDKGRFSGMMAQLQVQIVCEPRVGVIGAERVARNLLS